MGHYGKPDCRVAQLPIFGDPWAIFSKSKYVFSYWDEFNAKLSVAGEWKWIFRCIGNFAIDQFPEFVKFSVRHYAHNKYK